MPDEVNTTTIQDAGLPFTVPAGAVAMGMALVEHGEEGDAAEVCGLAVGLGPAGVAFIVPDAEPEPLGPEGLERMAAFLIGVAGSMRQKAAAATPLSAAAAQRPGSSSLRAINEEMA